MPYTPLTPGFQDCNHRGQWEEDKAAGTRTCINCFAVAGSSEREAGTQSGNAGVWEEKKEPMTEDFEDEGFLNSPVCVECGRHPEEGEEHDEECPYSSIVEGN